MEARAKEAGFRSLSDYLRALVQRDLEVSPKKRSSPRLGKPLTQFHTTKFGAMWNGDSLDWLTQAKPGSVDLVMTSPPFGLVRKKSYGNEDAHAYCDWFRPFAEGFKRVLKDIVLIAHPKVSWLSQNRQVQLTMLLCQRALTRKTYTVARCTAKRKGPLTNQP